jgi:hypothetical protein
MAFMGMLNVSSVKSFSGNCRGKVLEKFQIFSDTPLDYAGFDSGERRLAACSSQQLGDNTSRSEPQIRHRLSRAVVSQLSVERWGRYTSEMPRGTAIILLTTPRNSPHNRGPFTVPEIKQLLSIADDEYALLPIALTFAYLLVRALS